MPATKKATQAYPWIDGGVNENAAIRVRRYVIPNCPADPNPEILRRDGTSVPNPRYTGEPNCQQLHKINNMGRWDVKACEDKGHDPWHTKFYKTIVENVVDAEGYITEQRNRIQVETRLNVIQVSINPRHSTGMEEALAVARGCRPITDFGITEPCQFRNCVQPPRIKTRYGDYCSERHARLIAADMRSMILPIVSDENLRDETAAVREQLLENINIGAKDL